MQKVILNVVCAYVPGGGMAIRNGGMSVWLKVWLVIAPADTVNTKVEELWAPGIIST